MSHGYVLYTLTALAVRLVCCKCIYIHIGVRLRVARFDDMGNAKALRHEASNR